MREKIRLVSSAGTGHFIVDGNGTESVLSLDAGRVGIGTTTPTNAVLVPNHAGTSTPTNNIELMGSSITNNGSFNRLDKRNCNMSS